MAVLTETIGMLVTTAARNSRQWHTKSRRILEIVITFFRVSTCTINLTSWALVAIVSVECLLGDSEHDKGARHHDAEVFSPNCLICALQKRRNVHGMSHFEGFGDSVGIKPKKLDWSYNAFRVERKAPCAIVMMAITSHGETANGFYRPPSVLKNDCHALPLPPFRHRSSPHAPGSRRISSHGENFGECPRSTSKCFEDAYLFPFFYLELPSEFKQRSHSLIHWLTKFSALATSQMCKITLLTCYTEITSIC